MEEIIKKLKNENNSRIVQKLEEERETKSVSCFFKIFSCCSSPKNKQPDKNSHEIYKIEAFRQVPFDDSIELHMVILMIIWRRLSNTSINCDRYGEHWVKIGFQGSDPILELRVVNMFGLINLAYFSSFFGPAALEILEYSKDERLGFAFIQVAIQMSQFTYTTVRSGRLFNWLRKNDPWHLINFFYIGLFLFWFSFYKKNGVTSDQISLTFQETFKFAEKHPAEILGLADNKFREIRVQSSMNSTN
jgi:hypothetical protein